MGTMIMTTSESRSDRISRAIQHLDAVGVTLEDGLEEHEFSEIERDWDFTCPADLRWFLSQRVPVGTEFPSWREPSRNLQRLFDWPLEGIVFDVENSGYWRDEWGQRPNSERVRYELVRRFVADAPKLIPVAAHVYLPAVQHVCTVPVIAVYQTDVIHCGKDLAAYLMFYGHDDDLDEDD